MRRNSEGDFCTTAINEEGWLLGDQHKIVTSKEEKEEH
jgi:hypothetical protein